MGVKKGKSYGTSTDLPFDSRLIPDVLSFSHVRGIARIFLLMEIILSTLVVMGTMVLCVLKLLIFP